MQATTLGYSIGISTVIVLFWFDTAHCLHTTARPCNQDGDFLPDGAPTPPRNDSLTMDSNPWSPFQDRLTFDFAYHHYVELQSSKSKIGKGLDMMLAAMRKASPSVKHHAPWESADDMYSTIDSIDDGTAQWSTHTITYGGPKPTLPAAWMDEEYKFNVRDINVLVEDLLSSSEFDGQFEYVPYREYDGNNNRVYSNLFSGQWAYEEAVRFRFYLEFLYLRGVSRIKSHKIVQLMGPCSYL